MSDLYIITGYFTFSLSYHNEVETNFNVSIIRQKMSCSCSVWLTSSWCCICEVLEETVRSLEGRLVTEETEKLAVYERETQLSSKVTKYNLDNNKYIPR